MISVIGKGSYAKVLLVKNINDQNFYAMKILKKNIIFEKKQVEHVFTEK